MSDIEKPKEIKISLFPFEKIKWRLETKWKQPKRVPSGIETIDSYFNGGLYNGLTIFEGGAGTGKSLLAKTIAKYGKFESVLYFVCEAITDCPNPSKFPHVKMVDYSNPFYKPIPANAVRELCTFYDKLRPELIIIDSLTTFFGGNNKLISEADIRNTVSQLHSYFEHNVPIIGISEVRGTGYNEAAAGGRGVEHQCSVLFYFGLKEVEAIWDTNYGNIGDTVHTIKCLKDKGFGISNKKHIIVYETEYEDDVIIPTKPSFKELPNFIQTS